jgi:hypothetical protein
LGVEWEDDVWSLIRIWRGLRIGFGFWSRSRGFGILGMRMGMGIYCILGDLQWMQCSSALKGVGCDAACFWQQLGRNHCPKVV